MLPVIRFDSAELEVSSIVARSLATSSGSNGDRCRRGRNEPQNVEDRSDL